MPIALKTEKEIFSAALEITSPEARAAYLKGACGEDPQLRQRLESLLQAHGGAGHFLEGQSAEPPLAADPVHVSDTVDEGLGSIIGRYKLLQKIGDGGFGVVYMADQREPVKRRVALKIIKLGMDTKQVIGRFEAERQALAMMDHPNIAKVLDGGATDNGRPYFVMELVRGVPLMEFCDEHHLTLTERLDLFIQICSAIQHAHQKGVIHRDIKPSNVMITLIDGEPVPKVIDFGIAKATQQDLTDKTVFTRFHEFVGTPAYMSPEQAQMSGLDIDTRSDIYSLGVLLYELLTGQTPFDVVELIRGGYDEMRRRIREEEPLKPSTRLKTLSQEDRTHVAKRRRVEPAQLGSLLKGDLDWVVMKAMEKNRSRRYESAGALAQDVQRFLKQEPVTAAAPNLSYKFRKFAQRHRTILTTAISLALLLVVGTLVSAYFAVRAKRAEVLALRQAAIADAVKHFLNEDLFTQADPQVEPDREIRLKTAIDRAAQQIGERFRDQPLVEAEIRSTLAQAYRNLGENELAERNSRRAYELRFHELGEPHSATIEALSDVAMAQIAQMRKTEALATGQKAVELATNELGRLHPLALKTMSRLAWIYFENSLNTNAYDLACNVVSLAPQVPNMEPEYHAQALYVQGRTLGRRKQVKEGEQKLREAKQLLTATFGANHPFTLYSKNFLAAYQYDHRLNLKEAESLFKETMEQWRRIYGETHLNPLTVRRNLVYVYIVEKRFAEATHHLLKLLEFFPPDRQAGDLERLNWLLRQTPPEALAGAARLDPEHWLSRDSPPLSTWTQSQFPTDDWEPQGRITKSEHWWRQSFELEQRPEGQPVILIRNTGDFEVFLNGLPARQTPYGKLEKFQVVICDPQAQASLHPGHNVIALHGQNLNPKENLDVQFCRIPIIAPTPEAPSSASTR